MAHDRIIDFGLRSSVASTQYVGTQSWGGGEATFAAYGTYGGGSVALQWSADGNFWFYVPNASFTASGLMTFNLGVGHVRLETVGPLGGVKVSIHPTQR